MAKTDTTRIDSLEAIMADKRKHESYLAKLEERRESTPAHVFNRLRDEYVTKLTDLQVRASMEAEALTENLKTDEAAVAEIEAKLADVTEQRIEGELRAEVGEYDPKDWSKKLEALNASIAQIEKERNAKVSAFERTRSLLTEARGAATPVEPPPPAISPAPAPAVSPAPVAEPVAAPRASVPAPPPPVRQTPMGQPPQAPVVEATSAPSAPVAPSAPRTSTPAPAAPVVPAAEAPSAPSTAAPAPEKPAAPAAAPMAGSPSFDELAFLNSVVGRNSTPVKVDEALPPRPSGAARAMPTPPPVAPVAPSPAPPPPPVAPPAPRSTTNVRPPVEGDDSASGPLGRPTPRTSQAIKTLKCQECGTLNYPTEWYCERCGGELAAL